MANHAIKRNARNYAKPRARTLGQELDSSSALIRHIALCRFVIGEAQPGPSECKRQIQAALEMIAAHPRRFPDCVVVLLKSKRRLIELYAENEAQRRVLGRFAPKGWTTTERELEAANLDSTIFACLREHFRYGLL